MTDAPSAAAGGPAGSAGPAGEPSAPAAGAATGAGKGAVAGPDGRLRCPWGLSAADYLAYHDTEWGRQVHGDQPIFERLCLEAFQSGLSWLTILRKRENFRAAFAGFDIEAVAGPDLVAAAYRAALAGGYLWHEFGDSALLLPATKSPSQAQ